MNIQAILDPECWAKKTFGASQLNDIRRTGRAVKVAKRMAENPSATLPAHMQTWKETMAVYRLLEEEDVTFEALMPPHWQQTREQMETRPVMLLVQDTTEVDLSHHPKTRGLGQVGNERGRGLYVQTVLAVLPETGEVLGCAMQEPADEHSCSGRRDAKPAPTPKQPRNGCVDAPGEAPGKLSRRDHRCACRRSWGRYVSVLSGLPGDADPFSGARV